MNLRSGNLYQPVLSTPTNELEGNQTMVTSVCYLLKKLMGYAIEFEKSTMSKEEIYNEKIRIIREIYYLIDYYDLKTNPRFKFAVEILYKKAEEYLKHIEHALQYTEGGFRLTGEDRNSSEYLKKELLDFLQ